MMDENKTKSYFIVIKKYTYNFVVLYTKTVKKKRAIAPSRNYTISVILYVSTWTTYMYAQ